MSDAVEFDQDTKTEASAIHLFDQAYAIRFPRWQIHRFGDIQGNRIHRALQMCGVDVALVPSACTEGVLYELIKRRMGGEKTCILIDEKSTFNGGARPGLPIEVQHVWNGHELRPGWVLDEDHLPDLIAYGCIAQREVHLFNAREIKANWQSCIDQRRWSTKDNVGLYGDTWVTQAAYSKGYDCFQSHHAITVT